MRSKSKNQSYWTKLKMLGSWFFLQVLEKVTHFLGFSTSRVSLVPWPCVLSSDGTFWPLLLSSRVLRLSLGWSRIISPGWDCSFGFNCQALFAMEGNIFTLGVGIFGGPVFYQRDIGKKHKVTIRLDLSILVRKLWEEG